MSDNKALWKRATELLHYEPGLGLLTWRVTVSSTARAGEIAGCAHNRGYWAVMFDGRSYQAHRIAWLLMTGELPKQQIDHIDGDKRNNRWSNLRQVSNAENRQNLRAARRDNKLGVLGVRVLGAKYQARITLGGKTKVLGVFDTAEGAHAAYVTAKRTMHPMGQL